MNLVKGGIRWGRGSKRDQQKVRDMKVIVTQLESDLDDVYARLDRLESYVMELAHETGAYLPSFSSPAFKK
jgi:hypothetical protein